MLKDTSFNVVTIKGLKYSTGVTQAVVAITSDEAVAIKRYH